MASVWGKSWGLSWGNSWGALDVGGGGSSAKKKKKKKGWANQKAALEASREKFFKKAPVEVLPEKVKTSNVYLVDEINELKHKAEELRVESERMEINLKAEAISTSEFEEYITKDEEDAVSVLLLSVYMDDRLSCTP